MLNKAKAKLQHFAIPDQPSDSTSESAAFSDLDDIEENMDNLLPAPQSIFAEEYWIFRYAYFLKLAVLCGFEEIFVDFIDNARISDFHKSDKSVRTNIWLRDLSNCTP